MMLQLERTIRQTQKKFFSTPIFLCNFIAKVYAKWDFEGHFSASSREVDRSSAANIKRQKVQIVEENLASFCRPLFLCGNPSSSSG